MKKIFLSLVAFVLVLALSACGSSQIVWDDIVLGDIIPQPSSFEGEIHNNSAENLSFNLENFSAKQFTNYIETCKANGFNIDAQSNSSSYEAFNSNGYKLHLSYYEYSKEMSVRLEAPMELSDISWPKSAAGKKVPAPKSSLGRLAYDNDDSFAVYIGNMSITDYNEYIDTCYNLGFDENYSKGDHHFYAYDAEGWYLTVNYEGFNTVRISVAAPSEEDDIANSSDESSTADNDSALDPEFKSAMDSYEQFMDEYVDFMKKYKNNPSDISLIIDYAKFVSDYSKFVSEFEKWENEDLNTEELQYYIDVQARVSKKLLEINQ